MKSVLTFMIYKNLASSKQASKVGSQLTLHHTLLDNVFWFFQQVLLNLGKRSEGIYYYF